MNRESCLCLTKLIFIQNAICPMSKDEEGGHALVGALMPEYDPVAKISIIPRGQAGGLTFSHQVNKGLSRFCTAEAALKTKWQLHLVEGPVAEVIFHWQATIMGPSDSQYRRRLWPRRVLSRMLKLPSHPRRLLLSVV